MKIIAGLYWQKTDTMLIDRNLMVDFIKAVNRLMYDLVIVQYR